MEGLNMLPGHQQRMVKLFKLVETLNPKQQLRQTLANAVKKGHTTGLAYQRSNSREALSQDAQESKLKRRDDVPGFAIKARAVPRLARNRSGLDSSTRQMTSASHNRSKLSAGSHNMFVPGAGLSSSGALLNTSNNTSK